MSTVTKAEVPGPVSNEERVEWVRYGADIARAITAALVWTLVAGYALWRPESAQGISSRFVLLVAGLPDVVTRPLIGVVQLAAIVTPLAVLAFARRGRWRELWHAVGAAAITAVLGALLNGALADAVPRSVIDEADRPSWVTGAGFPSATYLAAVAAAITVVAPTVSRSWRRLLWSALAIVALSRVLTAVETPTGVISITAIGVFVGSLVMVAFKVPRRSPSPETVLEALVRAGVDAVHVRPTSVLHRHGPTYVASDSSGTESWFVKVVGRDERNAEMLSRIMRAVRVAAPDDRWTLGAVQTIQREALGLSLAQRAGVSVPDLVAVGLTDEDAAVLVMSRVEGQSVDEIEDPAPAVIEAAFAALASLHEGKVSHGWASLNHFQLADDDSVVLLDLRWSMPSASPTLLASDLAELLCSAAASVGIEAAVAAASASFSDEQMAAALPFIQPLVVTPETKRAIKGNKGILGDLRVAVQEASGVEKYEMAEIERLSLGKLVTFGGTVIMAILLLPLVANAGEIWTSITEMDAAYIPLLIGVPMLSTVAGAFSLMGAVRVRLALGLTTQVMFAQSFLNRFTPANAGGMAMRMRYLQRNGVPLVNAASGVGVTSAASGVMQVVLAITFFAWAGSNAQEGSEGGSFSFPSVKTILFVVIILLVASGVMMATAFGRKLYGKLKVNLASVWSDIRVVARQPVKLVMLFGGALGSKLFTIITLMITMKAFGSPVNVAAVGAMYITATTVAAAAPTPGGVGAIEAALIAGLTGLGETPSVAAGTVMVFRLFSYWLPILPSWFFLTKLQRSGDA